MVQTTEWSASGLITVTRTGRVQPVDLTWTGATAVLAAAVLLNTDAFWDVAMHTCDVVEAVHSVATAPLSMIWFRKTNEDLQDHFLVR